MLRCFLAVGAAVLTGSAALLPITPAAAIANDVVAAASGSGSVCSVAEPCSLESARAKARGLATASEGVTVVLRDGTYRLGETFTLTDADSGVTYRAEHPGKAVFDGGLPVSSWVRAEDGAWEATLPEGTKPFHDLFDGGVAQTIARSPNKVESATDGPWRRLGPDQPDCVKPDKEDPATLKACERIVDASGVRGGAETLVGAQLVMQGQWRYKELGIATVAPKTGSSVQVGFDDNDPDGEGLIAGIAGELPQNAVGFHQGSFAYVQDNTEPDAPYFFQGKAAFVDVAGEWFYDETTRKLRYKTGSADAPAPGRVVVPQVETLLAVDGSGKDKERTAANIAIDGLSFRYSNWSTPASAGYASTQTAINDWVRGGPIPGAVRLRNTNKLKFTGNRVRATAATGVLVSGVTEDITITGNDVQQTGGSGVVLYAGMSARAATYPDRVVGARVENNVIRDVGVHYADAGAVAGTIVCATKVEHNDLSGSGQSGVALGGFSFYKDLSPQVFDRCKEVEGLPAENGDGANAIVGNRIGASMRQLSDGGGIYVLGVMPKMRIAENLISGIGRGPWTGGNPVTGVYLDAHSQKMTIEHNVLDLPEQTHAFFAGNGQNHSNTFRENVYTSAQLGDINQQRPKDEPCDVEPKACVNSASGNEQRVNGDWSDIGWAVDVARTAGLTDAAALRRPLLVNTPTANAVADQSRPTVTGTGVPGEKIRVLGRTLQEPYTEETTVDQDGRWEATFNKDVPGSEDNPAGFWVRSYSDGVLTDQRELVIRPHQATARVTTPATDPETNVATVTGSLTEIAGDGAPDATVKVVGAVGGSQLGETTVDKSGKWMVKFKEPLRPQVVPYEININQRLGVQNVSQTRFRVHVEAALLTPAPGSTVHSDKPRFTGVGHPGATIIVRGTSRVIATTTVAADGKWSASVSGPLVPGTYGLRMEQSLGGVTDTTQPFTVTIDPAGVKVLQVISPTDGATVAPGTVEFTGTADPDAAITIRGTTSFLGAGTADSDGRWTITATRPLSAGEYHLTAQQTPYGAEPISPGVGFTVTVR